MRKLFRCKAYAFLQPETGNAVEMYEVLAADPAWLREPETLIRMYCLGFSYSTDIMGSVSRVSEERQSYEAALYFSCSSHSYLLSPSGADLV